MLVLMLAGSAGSAAAQTGRVRQLVCRGTSGIDLRLDRDPSPRNEKFVAMVLRYQRNTKTLAMNFRSLDPGTCTWNPSDLENQPPEPGVVYFDVQHEAQPWSGTGPRLMDTTVNAAEHFHDIRTVPRYLNDPSHYWVFYVDDVTNFSNSFGAFLSSGTPPTLVTISGSLTSDAARLARTAELRCRGGAGLSFHRGGSAGTNEVSMTLAYATSRSEAGENSRGLTQGTCAWVSRDGMRTEPGRMRFITAGNAQIKQAQSGSPVDRAPNAAERFPDANTIPVYLQDPAHYWTFTVTALRPDSAQAHGAWKWSATTAVVGSAATASPTRSMPGVLSPTRPPGNATAGVATLARAPLRVDHIGLVLDRFTIQFSGRPNASPTVLYSTEKPVQEPSTGRWFFPGGSGIVPGGFRAEVAGGAAQALRAQYTAWSRLTPLRGQLYYYIVTMPAGIDVREEQLTGQFTTVAQHARVVVTRIDLLNARDGFLAYWIFAASRTSLLADNRFPGAGEWKPGSHSLGDGIDVSNAPDQLRVQVGMATRVSSLAYVWDFNGRNKDMNYARTEVNIGVSPTERYVTVPFVARSIDGNYLMFEVHGQVNVTRK